MSITLNKIVGLTVAAAFMVTFFVPATASAQDSELEALLAQIAALQSEIGSLSGSTSVVVTSSASGNRACPYTWSRNLTIGSTGEDVRQLQRFLNGDAATSVSSSGVGSAGNESTYYGPATARAVSKFQEKNASTILTPIGLTQGTGGFYTSTRSQANSQCTTAPVVTTTPSTGTTDTRLGGNVVAKTGTSTVVTVQGDGLAVTEGKHPADGYAVAGAVRVPFTTFTLTAGDDDVVVQGVRVRRGGLSSDDNFTSVALVTQDGVQVGKSRKLNSRSEALIGGNFEVESRESVTFTVVGNMNNDLAEFDSGSFVNISVVEINTESKVEGNLPLKGAVHGTIDSIHLSGIEIEARGGNRNIELNKNEEIGDFRISLGNTTLVDDGTAISGTDEEDAYLRSITFEQKGDADPSDFRNVELTVGNDEYDAEVNGDRYTFNFGKKGVLIEEGDDIDVTISADIVDGSGEAIQFYIDEGSDLYVVGANYGYGLPVEGEDIAGNTYDIEAGSVSGSRRTSLKNNDFDIAYGDKVLLGAYEFEVEGEDVDIEDFTFEVSLSGYNGSFDAADVDEVSLENVYLEVNGDRVAFADEDIVFEEPDSGSATLEEIIDFTSSFTIEADDDDEALITIRGDLNDDWSQFDGAKIEFELVEVDTAEGAVSEDDYRDNFGGKNQTDNNITFDSVDITGNQVEFAIKSNGVDETSYIAGKEAITFGSLEVDASDLIDNIELVEVVLGFALEDYSEDAEFLKNCSIYDGDDRVSRSYDGDDGDEEVVSGDERTDITFRFDRGIEVEKGDVKRFPVRCDIDEDAVPNSDTFRLLGNVDTVHIIDYELNGDSFEAEIGGQSKTISVAGAGTLRIVVGKPDDTNDTFAVATGSNGVSGVNVLEIELEARDEDIDIEDIYLINPVAGVSGGAGTYDLEEVVESMTITVNGSSTTGSTGNLRTGGTLVLEDNSADTNTPDVTFEFNDTDKDAVEFENINETIEAGDEVTFTLSYDLGGVDENNGQSGQYVTSAQAIIVWRGSESDEEGVSVVALSQGSDIANARAFTSIPVVTASERTQSLSNGANRRLYAFTVTADDAGDIYLDKVTLNGSPSSGVTVSDVEVRRGTSSTLNDTTKPGLSSSTEITFDETERISAGQSVEFNVYATVAGVVDDTSIVIYLEEDNGAAELGQERAAVTENFVWSPDSLDNGDATTDNADWFNGVGIFESDDINSWTSERN